MFPQRHSSVLGKHPFKALYNTGYVFLLKSAVLTTALMQAFMPVESPPDVNTPILLMLCKVCNVNLRIFVFYPIIEYKVYLLHYEQKLCFFFHICINMTFF